MTTGIRVVVIEPAHVLLDLAARFASMSVLGEGDHDRAMERLANGDSDVGVVAYDLDASRSGVEFVRRVREAGCALPLLLVGNGGDELARAAALEAGANLFVDLTAGPRVLEWSIRFAHAGLVNGEMRHERLLRSVASFLSHEGKNALAGIGGALQIVSDRLPGGSQEQLISEEILERLRAFNATLETLTFVLRPPTEIQRAPLTLRALLDSVVDRFEGVSIEVRGDDVELLGDRARLGRLFQALIENAVEASEGRTPIEVEIEQIGQECAVVVTHSGPEVPATDLTRLLEPFYTTKPRGAGLGLPVAKRIAEAHGGSLRLSCLAGRGLRVTTRLPVEPPATG